MCGHVQESIFSTVHHEMGHLAYFMAYKDQPTIYKDAANDCIISGVDEVFIDAAVTVLVSIYCQIK